ncbi:MAG: hypothetical protein EOP59_07575 [Sphingomonadales bacterium]|nr:MAG: hypothetical protein EOP59_07575 [Sphingomonadales bacterium]
MSGFEFIFSLFGLILGLALAEGLGGLTRAIKARGIRTIGWSTGLLGLFVSCDVVTFWMYGWAMRDQLPLSWPVMFGGFLVTAVYYVATALVFPDAVDRDSDLDAHFERNYRTVMGAVLLCNMVLVSTAYALVDLNIDLRSVIITFSFFPVSLIAIFVRKRPVVIACLIWLIALYPLSAVWH